MGRRKRIKKKKEETTADAPPPLSVLADYWGTPGQCMYGVIPQYTSSSVIDGLSQRKGIADMTPYMPNKFMSQEDHEAFLKRLVNAKKTRYKYVQLTASNCEAFHQTIRLIRCENVMTNIVTHGTLPQQFDVTDRTSSKLLDGSTSFIAWPWFIFDTTTGGLSCGDERYDITNSIRCIDQYLGACQGAPPECCVCLDPLCEHTNFRGSNVVHLECFHTIHSTCFMELWKLGGNPTCPICRTPIHLEVHDHDTHFTTRGKAGRVLLKQK